MVCGLRSLCFTAAAPLVATLTAVLPQWRAVGFADVALKSNNTIEYLRFAFCEGLGQVRLFA